MAVQETHGHEFPRRGDKLGGRPRWVQGEAIVRCPVCAREMSPLVQIASNDNIPHRFGDLGTGHIHVCPAHPGPAAFAWSCS